MKRSLITVVLLGLLCPVLFATGAKVAGLGVPAWMTDDESLITDQPALLLANQGMAVFNITEGAIPSGFLILKAGPGALLVGASSNVSQLSFYESGLLSDVYAIEDLENILVNNYQNGAILSTTFHPVIDPVEELVNIAYGMDLSGIKAAVGISYGMNGGSEKEDVDLGSDLDDNRSNNSILALSAGVSLNAGIPVDLGLRFSLPGYDQVEKVTNDATDIVRYNETLKSTSAYVASLNARTAISSFKINVSATFAGEEFAAASQNDPDLDNILETNGKLTDKFGWFEVSAGAADCLVITKDISLIIGGQFIYASKSFSQKPENLITGTSPVLEDSYADMQLPLYAAFQSSLGDNWKARAGVSRVAWNSYSYNHQTKNNAGQVTANTKESSSDSPDAVISMGVSGVVGDFTLDLAVNADMVLDGPYFLSGSNNSLASVASVKYTFK